MMNVLVTGALGHIGSSFIRRVEPTVVSRVDLLDDLSTQRYASLFDLPDRTTYRFFEGDVCSVDLDSFLEGIDAVVHLAAITDAESSVNIPEEVERVNLLGTQRVAEACARRGSKMIFLSTTSVYGPQGDVVDEGCASSELRPQSPYADAKLRAERMLEEKGRMEGLDFVVFRFGTIVGPSPGMRFHTAINKFVWLACNGKPLTVWRTAMDQQRPYLDLEDAVAALNFALREGVFDRCVYNVVTTNTSIREIVEWVASCVPGVSVELVDSPIMNQLSYRVSGGRFIERGFRYQGDIPRRIAESVRLLRGVRRTVARIR